MPSKPGGRAPASAAVTREDDALASYRDKRAADRTPEPFGGGAATGAGVFVVQKHAASRLHYDLRLEFAGTLLSWAVPKGISPDPVDKKLAVHVEDHPVEYIEFEGIIPEDEYGGGEMIVWDLGRWIPLEPPEEGLESGKLLFELRGHKLRGVWTLVKIKGGETGKEWLLIREKRGGHPILPDGSLPETSILSGLTVEQLAERAAGWYPGESVAAELRDLGAREGRVDPAVVSFMLAKVRDEPFDDPEWRFELKLDGYRMLGVGGGGEALLLTRNGHDATASFPDVARALRKLPFEHIVLDGEIVVPDAAGFPSFQALQKRARLSRPLDVRRASVESPAHYYAFDLIGFDDFDLRDLPLSERARLLADVLPETGPIRRSESFPGAGTALYEQVQQLGLEGIMAKRADSTYVGDRSPSWLKIHAAQTDEFVIVGYTRPKKSRSGFGALHVGVYDPPPEPGGPPGPLTYAGRVGTGFDSAQLDAIRADLDEIVRDEPAFEGPAPKGAEHVWVEPQLSIRVRYKELTDEGLLRQPSFQGFVDMPPDECYRPRGPREALDDPVPVDFGPPPLEELPLSNLDKVFWPEEGYTKGDLIEYYRAIAPAIIPYLSDRPLVLTRYPDGIHGKNFFQKNAPGFAPEWIRTETIYSEGSEREIDYFIADNPTALVYLANLGTIPLHVWASRLADLDHPDWCLLDLDPKHRVGGEETYAPFDHVIEIARAIHDLCEEIGLPSYVKTSGSSGLHVLIPLGGQLEYDQSRALGQLLGKVVVSRVPKIATLTRNPSDREGRVYVDYVQNGRGRLVVSPYCVRPRPAAPVSAPLEWSEVVPGLTIEQFTITTMPERVAGMTDPMLPVLEERPDLLSALERLHTHLQEG
ncbi:MAG: DNA ligase D [Gemmatimonadota bacterium]|nr:DNA ligase D [Gemmatimonadota bacterium]